MDGYLRSQGTIVRTTPPRRIEVPAEFPELIPMERTTIRLHPRPGHPRARPLSSSFPAKYAPHGSTSIQAYALLELDRTILAELPFQQGGLGRATAEVRVSPDIEAVEFVKLVGSVNDQIETHRLIVDEDDDLALGVPLAEIPQRVRNLAQRESAVDHYGDLLLLAQLHHRADVPRTESYSENADFLALGTPGPRPGYQHPQNGAH